MPRNERTWHPDFIDYMKMIAGHKNYRGLPINRKDDGSLSWVTTGNSEMGIRRKAWANDKALELGYPVKPGVYAIVMRKIHPDKIHVCQICGSRMSIYYHYPSTNLVKALFSRFNMEFSDCDHISDIWDTLVSEGNPEPSVIRFFQEKFELNRNVAHTKDAVIGACERLCREEGKRLLSPGAMSDFPDRFDGFHTYNRCCRASEDTGRSKANLKSYTRDRRAFEYWSDGNIHAANMFMGSTFFAGTSADHIGAISLGFVHDPRYLRPMFGGDNSTKRDRLLPEDIDEILRVEMRTGVYPMSWYSARIWEHIKDNYRIHPSLVPTTYRDLLKQNMANFMFVLYTILESCGKNGENILLETIIRPKYEYFVHTYEFNSKGEITRQTARHFTERSSNEIERFTRIAFQSVYDYNDKDNRHVLPDLTGREQRILSTFCRQILAGNYSCDSAKKYLQEFMADIQDRLISI